MASSNGWMPMPCNADPHSTGTTCTGKRLTADRRSNFVERDHTVADPAVEQLFVDRREPIDQPVAGCVDSGHEFRIAGSDPENVTTWESSGVVKKTPLSPCCTKCCTRYVEVSAAGA